LPSFPLDGLSHPVVTDTDGDDESLFAGASALTPFDDLEANLLEFFAFLAAFVLPTLLDLGQASIGLLEALVLLVVTLGFELLARAPDFLALLATAFFLAQDGFVDARVQFFEAGFRRLFALAAATGRFQLDALPDEIFTGFFAVLFDAPVDL
jgi:hypothetical protein